MGQPSKRSDWYAYREAKPQGQTVIAKEHEPKPLLYAHDGTPLVSQPRPIGFASRGAGGVE